MQNKTIRKTFIASAVISELQSSDIYLTVKARLLDLRANLNGVRVTSAFLDEIVEHKDKYVTIPLCADVRGLLANKTIGHMYDARTGEFHSTAIGAFFDFEREDTEETSYLVGYARIMKRNKAVCRAISQLFADNALKFSFEISCGSYTEEDGTFVIDADEKNFLEGAAVVTFPACEDAVAMQLVAECLNGGEQEMQNENVTAEVNETPQEQQEQLAENEIANVETADTFIVREEHTEIERQSAYNIDTGAEVSVEQVTVVETRTPVQTAEEKPDEDDDSEEDTEDNDEEERRQENAEKQDEDDGLSEAAAASEEANDASDPENGQANGSANGSANEPELLSEFAEIRNLIVAQAKTIEHMGTLIAEMQKMLEHPVAETTPEVVIAENTAENEEEKPTEVDSTVNPFMAEMTAPTKYSLLEKAESPSKHYSLLDKA